MANNTEMNIINLAKRNLNDAKENLIKAADCNPNGVNANGMVQSAPWNDIKNVQIYLQDAIILLGTLENDN